jgi:YidC/Oxa1 family membrane protein insertase
MLNLAAPSTSGRACAPGAPRPAPPAISRRCSRRAPLLAAAVAADAAAAAASSAARLPPVLYLPHQALADLAAAVAAVDTTTTTTITASTTNDGGWLAPLTNTLEATLRALQGVLDAAHVPDSYGWSIVLLTLVVKTAVLPLTKQQVESSMAVQSLKTRVDLIKARYDGDKERVSAETSKLYKAAGVNPAAGCLPSLASIPVFIGLYRSLSKASEEGLFAGQGFLWIPSLSGPVTMAANRAGGGTAWLWPLDPATGAPPVGWHDALCYLSLPLLLVIAQFASSKVISPPVDPKAEGATTARVLGVALPLMVGWFALNVPSGLGLYYLSNTLVTTGQQVWLRKLGGADVRVNDLGPVTKPGTGRRLGPAYAAGGEADEWRPPKVLAAAAGGGAEAAAAAAAMDPEVAKAERQRREEEERRLQLERRLVKRAKQQPAAPAGAAR